MHWLNIDIPLKTATIHITSCRHMSDHKKRPSDGGWTKHDTLKSTIESAEMDKRFTGKLCGHCMHK